MSSAEALSEQQLLEQASGERAAGRLEEAVRIYRSILQESPQNSEAQKALHSLQKTMKQTSGKSAGKSSRGKGRSRKKRQVLKSGSATRQAPAQPAAAQPDADKLPSNHEISRLQQLYVSGRLEETKEEIMKLLPEYPRAAILFNLLGTVLSGLGENDKAIASYVEAVTIKPDYTEVHTNLGKLLFTLGMLEEAYKSFRHAQLSDPNSAPAFIGQGHTCRELGKLDEAVENYRKGIALEPNNSSIYLNLGVALYSLGKFDDAISCYRKSLELKPDDIQSLNNFANAVIALGAVELTRDCMGLIVRCLQTPEVDSNNVSLVAMKMLLPDLRALLDVDPIDNDSIRELTGSCGDLLCSFLKNALVNDQDAEKVLTRVRAFLLSQADAEDASDTGYDDLLEALAFQGFLNEYIWDVTEDEEQALDRLEQRIVSAISGGEEPEMADLHLLAAYRPLVKIDSIRKWAVEKYEEQERRNKALLREMILNPVREAEIRETLERITPIEDSTSQNVRSQYEQNPYPRWDSLSAYIPQVYTKPILAEIHPHVTRLETTSSSPEVLIAGCGTGKQPIVSALAYKDSNVLAVDLSRTSLSFAQRKAEELKVENVKFAQADIMMLGELDTRFDVIECGGVLHHMADPEAGLKVLVGLLKPGGYLKIGLYSALARQHIQHFRELVSEKEFEPTLEGMRKFRRWVREQDSEQAIRIQQSRDYYSASTLRDLVFHVQEHQLTLPQIMAYLETYKLEFLGFSFHSPLYKTAYTEAFPDDPYCLNLENWHRFEQEHNNIFSAMYNFWSRKSADQS